MPEQIKPRPQDKQSENDPPRKRKAPSANPLRDVESRWAEIKFFHVSLTQE